MDLVTFATSDYQFFHLPIEQDGNRPHTVYSASCTHVSVLSPEVRVYPVLQATTTSVPFLIGNTESVHNLLPCGNSLQVPEREHRTTFYSGSFRTNTIYSFIWITYQEFDILKLGNICNEFKIFSANQGHCIWVSHRIETLCLDYT